jgi:DNA repair photolyase
MVVRYKEMKCKSVLGDYNFLKTGFGTNHCFDPYTNCEFNCVYCHAGVRKYGNDLQDVLDSIWVKTNCSQVLNEELTRLKRKGVLRLSGNTDPYQPAEKRYKVTKQILEVLTEHNWSFAIGTKSDLVLRDIDLISQASEKSWCTVALTITTLDRNLARLLEPNAPTPQRRLEVLRKLSDRGITVGVWLAPIIPYVTDDDDNMARVIEATVESGAMFLLGGILDMRNLIYFGKFLKEQFPELVRKYDGLYAGKPARPSCGNVNETYLYDVYERFISLCQKYGVKRYTPHFGTRKQALIFYGRNFSKFNGTPIFELTQTLNFMFPSKEFFNIARSLFGNSFFGRRFLNALGYFPN